MSNCGRGGLVGPDAIRSLEDAVVRADMRTGRRILAEIAGRHGYQTLISDVFEPVLTDLGERLKRQEVPLAQSYVVSLMADEVLRLYLASDSAGRRQAAPLKGPVVMANIEDDCHPLGRKIVSTFLQINQWDVHDLGIDVEAGAIVEEAISVGARVIGVSAMIFTTAENVLKVRQQIDARGYRKRIKLAVGGAVFRLRPELVTQVGADGSAPNAFAALALFEELWRQAEGWSTYEQSGTVLQYGAGGVR